jgi:hypothetical protein
MRFITMVEVSFCTPGRVASLLIPQGLVGLEAGGGDAEEVVGVAEQPFRAASRHWDDLLAWPPGPTFKLGIRARRYRSGRCALAHVG